MIETAEGGPLRARHAEVLKLIADLKGLAGTSAEEVERMMIDRLASERDTAMAKVGSPLLRELYEKANNVVTGVTWSDPNQSPVCDTKLTGRLSEHLKQRIAQYAAADEANVKLESAIEAAASIARLGELETALGLAVPATDRIHGAIIQAAGDHVLPTTEIQRALSRLDVLDLKRTSEIRRLETERNDIEQKLPPSLVAVSRMLAAVKQFCDAISSHGKAVEILSTSKRDLAIRQRWKNFIGAARDAFSAAEAKLANQRITFVVAQTYCLPWSAPVEVRTWI
jgi:hypothetical protein